VAKLAAKLSAKIPSNGLKVFLVLFRLTRGYRLRPWRSPYLLWRIETYSGLPADQITPSLFFRFAWQNRWDLLRYLRWAATFK
jgi:hypothetical protein